MKQSTLNRRSMLGGITFGACSLATSSWMPSLVRAASDVKRNDKAVILLWLNGGPATIDLWDLKPHHANGGAIKEIQTNVAGARISEHLPQLAKCAGDFSIIRSMATREGDHSRARVVSLTGYTPQGAIQFPSLGSLVAHELHEPQLDIPAYVHIGGRPAIANGGFLGPNFAPFTISSNRGGRTQGEAVELRVEDISPAATVSDSAQYSRLSLLEDLRTLAQVPSSSSVVTGLDSARDGALRLMRPEAAAAFKLDEEDAKLREAYGRGVFGQGCLMARRLVERGVRFIEVTLDGWDTHSNNFERVKELSSQLDHGFATLLSDLKQRGLLESTLVVCQGEFGRTPKINGQAGRDHWPSSWSVALGGAGIKGGQVIGQTSNDGTEVESNPTRTPDLMATIFKSIGLDPMKQNMSNVSRPIRLADPEANAIEELL